MREVVICGASSMNRVAKNMLVCHHRDSEQAVVRVNERTFHSEHNQQHESPHSSATSVVLVRVRAVSLPIFLSLAYVYSTSGVLSTTT